VPGTAYGVLCGAPCPVLILKQATDAPEGTSLPLARVTAARSAGPDH
jgi:hypothetical protein